MDERAIAEMAAHVRRSRELAVLTGAGISTASGIPDFRSASGLYSRPGGANVFELDAFDRDPSYFYRFARDFYPTVRRAAPNRAHTVLAEWARDGRRGCIATQNVDDLHQRAGSSDVYPVHGTFLTSTCRQCRGRTPTRALEPAIERGEVPHCPCGGVWKPDITFFGEMLPPEAWEQSLRAMQDADLVLVLGTSLAVYPAAALPGYRAPGTPLIIVNRDATALDDEAEVAIAGDLAETLGAVQAAL